MRTRTLFNRKGFTLVELMIVVVILGLLAAIAIPAFSRYVRKSKTAEATGNISRLMTGQVTAYQHEADTSLAHFIGAGPTPGDMPTASKYAANPLQWTDDPAWAELGFSIDTPHYFQYEAVAMGGRYESSGDELMVTALLLLTMGSTESGDGSADGASFIVSATGDLDGDETYSIFQREGYMVEGELQLTRLRIQDELE